MLHDSDQYWFHELTRGQNVDVLEDVCEQKLVIVEFKETGLALLVEMDGQFLDRQVELHVLENFFAHVVDEMRDELFVLVKDMVGKG